MALTSAEPAIFEAVVVVTLAEPTGLLFEAEQPEAFGFIITLGSDSFSCAVIATDSAQLLASQPCHARLRFLLPETAARTVHPGSCFSFFDQGRRGTGYVLSVHFIR